jgi:hypothetical protein
LAKRISVGFNGTQGKYDGSQRDGISDRERKTKAESKEEEKEEETRTTLEKSSWAEWFLGGRIQQLCVGIISVFSRISTMDEEACTDAGERKISIDQAMES